MYITLERELIVDVLRMIKLYCVRQSAGAVFMNNICLSIYFRHKEH